MSFNSTIDAIDSFVWSVLLMVLILGVGLWLTIRTRAQGLIGDGFRNMFSKESRGNGEVSPFAALCTALAATIGTGNIVGVATAICAGGPGALFLDGDSRHYGHSYKICGMHSCCEIP